MLLRLKQTHEKEIFRLRKAIVALQLRAHWLDFVSVTYLLCRSQWPRGPRHGSAPFACWDCWFESHRVHGCLFLVSAVCCQVEVSIGLITHPEDPR